MSFVLGLRTKFLIICLISVFAVVFWYFSLPSAQRSLNKLKKTEEYIASMENELANWSINNSDLELAKKIVEAEKRVVALENIIIRHNLQWTQENTISEERELGRELDFASVLQSMINHVTVVVFSFQETRECLEQRVHKIVMEYPNISMIVLANANYEISSGHNIKYIPNIQQEGKALEIMASKLTTRYFLYLSSGAEIASHDSNQSVSWLVHALDKIPELDFVGGSSLRYEAGLKYPVLEIPCYRLRICNWTLSQSFEYRSVMDDMMICEETSSSFMGRTSSLKKVGSFDPNLGTMATTDFFFRAKGKAIVGLRPEVMFNASSTCAPAGLSVTREADLKLPFMRKHQLYLTRDSFGREVKAIDSTNFRSLNYGLVHWRDHTYANPFYNRGLLQTLEFASDFFEEKNISYWIDAGVALGAIKMRGLLPWDRDIDTGFFTKGEYVLQGLKDRCKAKGVKNCGLRSERLSNGGLEIWLYGLDSAYNTLYEQTSKAQESWFMYLYIHGRRYPLKTNLFKMMRKYYGERYLEMHVDPSAKMKCSKSGHHACVPLEFSNRGGHWRDFYCQL